MLGAAALDDALAANFCEEVDNVDASSVAAPGAVTAFAVPNPNALLAEGIGFFGSGGSRVASRTDRPVYFGLTALTPVNPFDRRQMRTRLSGRPRVRHVDLRVPQFSKCGASLKGSIIACAVTAPKRGIGRAGEKSPT